MCTLLNPAERGSLWIRGVVSAMHTRLKIILFGSYARGGWVDEPHTRKCYRSDFDLLVVVNNRKLTAFAGYWQTAADRLMREINTPVSFIVHSRREVNTALRRTVLLRRHS